MGIREENLKVWSCGGWTKPNLVKKKQFFFFLKGDQSAWPRVNLTQPVFLPNQVQVDPYFYELKK